MSLSIGMLCTIKYGARDSKPEHWGKQVELVDGPEVMYWWDDKNTDRAPDVIGPAWICAAAEGQGWVLEESLKPVRGPREPTCSWDDVPYFNPTVETV